VDTGEDCDLGDLNSDAPNAACRMGCGLRRCGDGVQDDGEACDDGIVNGNTADTCRATCALPTCGDGVVDTGEECDDGQGNSWAKDACRPTCELAACGDGIVDTGEVCDGRGETAACNANCTPWQCGDGILNRTAGEECDQFTVVTNGWCELGCHVACASTFGDCNHDGEDGCETTLTTDPLNCGVCGHDCGGGSCIAGKCQPVQLADLPESSRARVIYADGVIAVGAPLTDAGDTIGGGTVMVPPDARAMGHSTMSNAIGYLALPYVFGKTSLTTGITEEIVPLSASTAFVCGASDGASIYWAAQDRGVDPYQDAIWQYTFGDAAPALVTDYRPTQTGIANFNHTIANDAAVFTAAGGPAEIWRVEMPPAAPAPLKVGTPSDSLYALAASGDWLVFTTPAGISKIPTACTGPASCLETTVMASGGKILLPLVIDDTHVYWAEHTTAVIGGSGLEPSPVKRISLASGVVETMAPNAINVADMVGVGGYIYWAEAAAAPATGKVWKLAK
jgi:cysteine-rich repeat protein